MLISKLMPFLASVVPACISFGPFFLAMGVLQARRNGEQGALHWRAKALVIGGAVMITLALMYMLELLTKLKAASS